LTKAIFNPYRRGGVRWIGLAVSLGLVVTGCKSQQPPVYRDQQGFRFTPPPGWVERARDDALPAKSGHRQPDLPLPKLGGPGSAGQERLLVRYDRLTAGHLAWLRVTVADLAASTPLQACLSARSPGSNWKRESQVEALEVGGQPAARIAFVGRWGDQEYLCETVGVRQGERVYLVTASFPASDGKAREQVRKAVVEAAWK
jgi:hypothetical protein